MPRFGFALLLGFSSLPLCALPRDPAVSRTHVAFVEAGQLWVMPRGGGVATRVGDLPGRKFTPRFSPDGKSIAFGSNEARGEVNLYSASLAGGPASRITFLPSQQRLTQWTGDGRLLFDGNAFSFSQIENQLFTVPATGGLPVQLPVAYGSEGALDDSGEWLAYTPRWQMSLIENWKRYRGGAAPDIWLLNLRTHESRRITQWDGSDRDPMWHGTTLYYLSDEGAEQRMNVWAYEMRGGTRRQVTHFRDYDVRNASIGPDAIVFELGPEIQLLDLRDEKATAVRTAIPPAQMQRDVDAGAFTTNRQLANGGAQLLIEARGDLWLAGAGSPRNLTATSGAFEREASLSPDGRSVAYWSDATGEYQLYVRDLADAKPAAPLTQFTDGFRYRPVWSPDSRYLAFADHRSAITIFELATRRMIPVDTDPWAEPTELAWSADSKWLAYVRTGPNRLTEIWGYDLASGKRQQLTASAFNAATPVFDPSGDHLFFISYRNFNNVYSDWIQQRVIHRGLAVVMAVPLRETSFDMASFERRAVRLGSTSGSITALAATHDGNPIYALTDLSGKSSVRLYDLRKQEEVVVPDADGLTISSDGRHLLVSRDGKSFMRELGGTSESPINTSGMTAHVDLRQEWQQIFDDVWRDYRDLFYAPKVGGLHDWNLVRSRYEAMLRRCLTRYEVLLVLGEMIGESSVSHAYLGGGGDFGDPPPPATVAMLGADFALENGAFRITRIVEGAPWDDRARSPLRDAAAGDYLLAVPGNPIDIHRDPRAAFLGMAGKPVKVTVGPHPAIDASSREITIVPLANEYDLRRRAWIEQNRRHIDEASGGRIGYIHIPDFALSGFNDFEQQFSGQIDKDALVIDARWSLGGGTPAFIELLERRPLLYRAARASALGWPWPGWGVHAGPKAVLVNHFTVSAGEAFALSFRNLGLGSLIGERTWGGSTALSPVPALLDGGTVNVPNSPFFDETGWLFEGHGVEPDVPIEPDPASEGDSQIDAAIATMMKTLKTTARSPAGRTPPRGRGTTRSTAPGPASRPSPPPS